MRPIVAAVASDDPHMAANPAQPASAAIASPPRLCPITARAARNRLWLKPERAAHCPIRMNSGTTERS